MLEITYYLSAYIFYLHNFCRHDLKISHRFFICSCSLVNDISHVVSMYVPDPCSFKVHASSYASLLIIVIKPKVKQHFV
jgi:hypothetical protein